MGTQPRLFPSQTVYLFRQKPGSEAQASAFSEDPPWHHASSCTWAAHFQTSPWVLWQHLAQSQAPCDGSIHQLQPPWQTQDPSNIAKEWKPQILVGFVTEMMRAKQRGWSPVVLSTFHRRRCAVAAAGSNANSWKRHACALENTAPVMSSEPKVASHAS